MAGRTTPAALLLLGVLVVDATRVRLEDSGNETKVEDKAQMGCADYCVMCNDGSTIWYGRSRSWFRSFINLFTEGIIVPIVGVTNMYFKASRDDYTSWTGYLPTTGLFCERVDVIKFPADKPARAFTPYMLYDRNWFGKIELNELKPYTPDGYSDLKEWAKPDDFMAYVAGCKVMKASGMSGSWEQFKANFAEFCENSVTRSVFDCSQHSRLCGESGVKHLTHAISYEMCQSIKNEKQHPPKCAKPLNMP